MLKYYHLCCQEDPRGQIIGTTLGINKFAKELEDYEAKDENYSVQGFVKHLLKKGICAFVLETTLMNF